MFDPNYLFIDIAAFLGIWTVPLFWLLLVLFRYIRKQQEKIDALHDDNDRLHEANTALWDDLEQCYKHQPSQDWIDRLAEDVFGDDAPSEPNLRVV